MKKRIPPALASLVKDSFIEKAAVSAMSYLFPNSSFTGASTTSPELRSYTPPQESADGAYLPNRETLNARARDLSRNSGWAKSALARKTDNVIGVGLRLSSKPDFAALGIDSKAAILLGKELETKWRGFAEDPDFYLDATRQDNFNGLIRKAYTHWTTDGEVLVLPLYKTDKPSGKYKTTFQIVDPDRLCNPNRTYDTDTLRAGIEFDTYGAPIAYHILKAHPSDFLFTGAETQTWERIERETPWGRRRVIHAFRKDRADLSRGISSFATVIEKLKMIDRYDQAELNAALLNASLAAFIESPMDPEMLLEALEDDKLGAYQKDRKEFHDDRKIQIGGTRITALYPGEKVNMANAARPAAQFADFERACLRYVAAGFGITYEQLTMDWSQVNYSSARAALMEIWKSLLADRQEFIDKVASQLYILWLEEAFDRGLDNVTSGMPDFNTHKAAYGRCKWIGQGRGYIDPEKEIRASMMRIELGISTYEDECAEQGKDWEEVFHQQQREFELRKSLGLPMPESMVAASVAAASLERNIGESQQ